ncbi:aminodeoxychorismate synthase component I [Halopseudomonas salina]|uniref:aminodeoxychorismate synthase n=1 Tax=Halopseudomonas salina TaxID=1323744 RepID=A0ABQ1Q110_9GAMM|nr:aminodeoxychorismate synthase component I [Halopseudomonas salina]GGD09951.1 aminodeoxychorismate synthase, component I [Halopseudomonas salina]
MTAQEQGCYLLTELPYQGDPIPRLNAVRVLGQPVLLDSAAGIERFARFSILAAGPRRIISPSPGESGKSVLSRLRGALSELPPAAWPDDISLPFGAGALGFISYDFGRLLEVLPTGSTADISLPLLEMGIYAWSVISDHSTRRCWLVCHPDITYAERKRVQYLLDSEPEEPGPFKLRAPFQPEQSSDAYQRSFRRIKDYIHSGDCYQINLAQRFSARCSGDALQAYRQLRAACPVPFAAYIESADHNLLCLSPERFLSARNGAVETRPIKGTRARGANAEEDAELARELQACLKDRAENLMIVDLLRNDLSRSCALGSVRVPELFKLETYPNVHHLVSSVTGQLEAKHDAFDLVAASFPGGSITGAPKIRAMQIIEELEPVRRSLYCGSIGYIGCEGQMDLNIAIRSLVHQDDTLYCWGGGGIVDDSEGEAEYQETLTKVRVLMEALE